MLWRFKMLENISYRENSELAYKALEFEAKQNGFGVGDRSLLREHSFPPPKDFATMSIDDYVALEILRFKERFCLFNYT